jgi:N-acetylmuramoyl-L-alanine amidase
MKNCYSVWLLAAMMLMPATQYGQRSDFSGLKIFVNPGHGGYDGDDRHMIATDFWESEGNLTKGLFLRQLLEDRNATVYMSRTTNFTSDDLPLSTIAAMANTANVDFFISIHSNGFDGTRNQPLVLFRGYDNAPVYPAAKTFAHILWAKLFEKGNCWTHTSEWVKGDWTFYPDWGDKVGLGVLRTLNMPGVLSEGSFHDYIPEGWRLRNPDHLHHEVMVDAQGTAGILQRYRPGTTAFIAGTVRDGHLNLTQPWYFKPGSPDEHIPINGSNSHSNPFRQNSHHSTILTTVSLCLTR